MGILGERVRKGRHGDKGEEGENGEKGECENGGKGYM